MTVVSKTLIPIVSNVKCPHLTFKSILLPLCFLGLLGFIINSQLTLYPDENLRHCRARSNIVFLKTHKCAGSSVQNVIMRFGDRHNLTFVLPQDGNYIGHPMPFSSHLLPAVVTPTPAYNILAHHTRLDHMEIIKIMPSDTIFVTIVRDPAKIFESSFIYYGLDKFFGGNLHKFLHLAPQMNSTMLSRRYRGKFGVNQMMFDLGADESIFHDEHLVRQYVEQLDSWFHLVLVAERMDESLILFKHLMCWDINDVVVFKMNARSPKYKSRLSVKEISTLRTLNNADQVLYDHFAQKLDGLVKAFGVERMQSEVSRLQRRTKDWYELCVKGEELLTIPHIKTKRYYNPRVMVFEQRSDTNNSTCDSLTIEELPYTDFLRKKQKFMYPVKSPSKIQTTSHHS